MSMFQQYQSGIQGVQGISEAGANIGRMTQQGMQDFGKSLAEGIQAYHQNQALDEQATQEGHAVAQQLAFYHQVAAMSPENSALLPALDEQVKSMQKLPTMSLTQKLGALNGAKSVLSQFGQNYQLNQMMQQQRALNALPEAEKSAEGENVIQTPAVIKSAQYDWNLSPQQNIDKNLIPKLRAGAAVKGSEIMPDAEAISQYLGLAQAQAKTAVDAQGNPINPTLTASAVEQLDKYLKYQDYQNEGDISPDGATDYAKEADLYKASTESLGGYLKKPELSKESYDRYKSDVNAVLGFDMSSTKEDRIKQANEKIKDVDKLIASTQKSIDEGETTSKSTIRKVKDWFESAGFDATGVIISKLGKLRAAYSNEKITPDNAEQIVRDTLTISGLYKSGMAGGVQTFKAIIPQLNYIDSTEIGKALFGRDLTRSEVKAFDEAFEKVGLEKKEKMYQKLESPEERLSVLKDQKKMLTESVGKISAEKTGEAPIEPTQAKVNMPTVDTGMQVVGSLERRTPLTLDQRRQQTQDWYKKEYGYIPSSFNTIWEQQHPEAKLKVVTDQATGLSFFSDGKGEWKLVPQQKEGLSPSEMEASAKFQGRKYDNEELFPDTGIIANGVITGDKVDEVKNKLSQDANALQQIKELEHILATENGISFRPNLKAVVQKYTAFLKSAVRPELFPSGRVAEWEQKILDDIVPDAQGVFTLKSSTEASLKVLKKQMEDNLKSTATRHGVSISYSTAPKQISMLAAQARQAKRVTPRPKQ